MQSSRIRIADISSLLIVDLRRCDDREVLDVYQHLALLLRAPKPRHPVLLLSGSEGAEIHYTLRDIVYTLVRVMGDSPKVDVAVVGGSLQLRRVCSAIQPALSLLGCELRLFGLTSDAISWLLTDERQASERAGACAAIP